METENPYKSPEASFDTDNSGKLSDVFERFTAWAVFGLGIITLGIYSIYWLVSRTKQLNAHVENPIGNGFVYTTLVLYVVYFLSSFVGMANAEVGMVLTVIGLPSIVLMIVWAFKIRNRIHTYVGAEPKTYAWGGPILTFFFGALYLQYKINKIIDNQ